MCALAHSLVAFGIRPGASYVSMYDHTLKPKKFVCCHPLRVVKSRCLPCPHLCLVEISVHGLIALCRSFASMLLVPTSLLICNPNAILLPLSCSFYGNTIEVLTPPCIQRLVNPRPIITALSSNGVTLPVRPHNLQPLFFISFDFSWE